MVGHEQSDRHKATGNGDKTPSNKRKNFALESTESGKETNNDNIPDANWENGKLVAEKLVVKYSTSSEEELSIKCSKKQKTDKEDLDKINKITTCSEKQKNIIDDSNVRIKPNESGLGKNEETRLSNLFDQNEEINANDNGFTDKNDFEVSGVSFKYYLAASNGNDRKNDEESTDDGHNDYASDTECGADDSFVINKENLINYQNDDGEGETNKESSSEYDSQAESSSDFNSDSDSDSDSDDNQWNDDNSENIYETCSDISSDSEDDGVVSSIKSNKKKKKEINPSPLVVQDIISCISFSPTNDTIAVGSMVGIVKLYDYNQNALTQQILKTKHIIRGLEWSNTGNTVYVADSNNKCHIVDLDKNVRIHSFTNPEESVYCMKAVEDNKLITGDDNGIVRAWDLRTSSKSTFRGNAEATVTSIVVVDSFISATTVEGHVFGFDMRNKKNIQKSEQFSAEINCSGLFKSDRKLVCGTSDGNLITFSWNRYDNWEDQYKPSTKDKSAINCLLPITEHIALTGTDTGIIRATNLYPMKRLGIVGFVEMINGRQSGIHAMDINYSGNIFGVSTMDRKVLFYNISCMKYVNFKNPKYKEDYLFPTTNKLNRSEFFTGLE